MSEQKQLSVEQILTALQDETDPLAGFSFVEYGLIRDVVIQAGKVTLTLVSIVPLHPQLDQIKANIANALTNLAGIEKVEINVVVDVPKDARLKGTGNSNIKTLIAVASGKGGVGKSTVSVNLAVILAQMGEKVCLMDADVYGPNIPMMMGVRELPPQKGDGGIIPAEIHQVKLISIGFMVKPDQPIVWRGPMLHSAIQQFVRDVAWDELDYLIVDLPPGTGDAQLSLAQTISITGGVIVTLPQQVSLEDARRGLEMFRQLDIPILGVVENMSYLELPDGQIMDVFGTGGGEKMAEAAQVRFLGPVPMDPAVREGGDSGKPIALAHPDSKVTSALREISIIAALEAGIIALKNQQETLSIKIS
jgi:ATP-binding protein involved in chromosome partitioning